MEESRPEGRSAENIRAVGQSALDVPLLKLINAQLIDPADPSAGMTIYVGEEALNAVASLHAGAMATCLEVTAYLALLPSLASNEDAATHGSSASYIRPGRKGDTLTCNARVLHRTRRLAFVFAELMRDDELIATATVTKSIVRVTTD